MVDTKHKNRTVTSRGSYYSRTYLWGICALPKDNDTGLHSSTHDNIVCDLRLVLRAVVRLCSTEWLFGRWRRRWWWCTVLYIRLLMRKVRYSVMYSGCLCSLKYSQHCQIAHCAIIILLLRSNECMVGGKIFYGWAFRKKYYKVKTLYRPPRQMSPVSRFSSACLRTLLCAAQRS